METVAERMADYFVGHHPTMPGSGKTAQAIDAARCLKDCSYASMMTTVPRPGKTTAAGKVDRITVVLRALLVPRQALRGLVAANFVRVANNTSRTPTTSYKRHMEPFGFDNAGDIARKSRC
jgi:hypothetical protein